MRLHAHLTAIALVLSVTTITQGSAIAAPPGIERPAPDAPSTNQAVQREHLYAGLSLGDAIRQSLIDDDLDFAFKTMSALGQVNGDTSGSSYFNAVRAFGRDDFDQVSVGLKTGDSSDMLSAALLAWSHVARGNVSDGVAAWDAYGKGPRKPFYLSYRGLLAEQAGDSDGAVNFYKQAGEAGELFFAKDLAKRYSGLLARAGNAKDALTHFDEVFGQSNELDAEDSRFRATLTAPSVLAPTALTPRQAVSSLMSNYAAAGILVRMMQARAAAQPTSEKPELTPTYDNDTTFVSDALTLRSALLINPSNENARFTLARMMDSQDEDQATLKLLEPITTGPRLTEARLLIAGIYNGLEQPSRGLEVLEQIPTPARDADWFDRQGNLKRARGDFAGALVAAQRSQELSKGKGEWAESLSNLSLAQALVEVNREREAIEIARSIIRTLKKDNPIRGAAGQLLAGLKATREEGLPAAREGLVALGADGRSRASLGGTLVKDPSTRAEGIQMIRDGLEEYPRSASIMNSLGYVLVEYDVDLEEGFTLLQKAHELKPESGAVTDSLGRAHYKLGNLDEAQRLIEEAIARRFDSPDPEIYDNLGDVYWHQGRQEDARKQWLRARELGGRYDRRDELDGKIAKGITTPAPKKRDVPVYVEPGSV